MGGIFNKSSKDSRIFESGQTVNGPPPLRNEDETCYMNSIVQALGSCNKMKEDLENFKKEHKSDQLILFVKLLNALNSPAAQKEFDDFISLYGWCKQGQQDSYEVMSFIINSMYSELKENIQKSKESGENVPFPGVITMNSKTSCCCDTKNKNIIQDLAFHLPLVNDGGDLYNLQNLISSMFKKDQVDDLCDKCKKTQMLSVEIEGDLPRTICLHIQANKFDSASGTIVKPKYILDYPYILQINSRNYELVSFLNHSGGVTVGHYMAFRKFKENWFLVNDNVINRLKTFKSPKSYCTNPYVLFYELICET